MFTDVLTALLFYHFHADWLRSLYWTIVSLYRAGEEKPIERYKTSVKVAEEKKLFSPFQKILLSVLGSTSKLKSSAWGHLTWKFAAWRKSMARRRITPYRHSSNWSWNCHYCLAQMERRAKLWEICNLIKNGLYVCTELLRFAIFGSCCQQAHGHSSAITSQEPTGLWISVISLSNSVKSLVV